MVNIELLSAALACAGLGLIVLKAIAYGRASERQKYLKQERKINEKVDKTINNNSVLGRDSLLMWLLSIPTKKQ